MSRSQDLPEPKMKWVARRCASLMNAFWMLLGSLIFVHATSFIVQLQQQGHWSSFGDMAGSAWRAYRLVVISCFSCFIEMPQAEQLVSMDLDFDVWLCFVPAITSFFCCFTSSLGMNIMRRPIPALALLYAICAAIMVAFQTELLQALADLRALEDPTIPSDTFDTGKLFKEAAQAFEDVWNQEGCTLIADELRCQGEERGSLQGSLFPTMVQEFCRSTPDRLQVCEDAGIQLLRWNTANTATSERNRLYCGCWVSLFDLIESAFFVASSMLLSYWANVMCVLHIALEPSLRKMSFRAQQEVWSFGLLATCAMLVKVAWIAHGPLTSSKET